MYSCIWAYGGILALKQSILLFLYTIGSMYLCVLVYTKCKRYCFCAEGRKIKIDFYINMANKQQKNYYYFPCWSVFFEDIYSLRAFAYTIQIYKWNVFIQVHPEHYKAYNVRQEFGIETQKHWHTDIYTTYLKSEEPK